MTPSDDTFNFNSKVKYVNLYMQLIANESNNKL